MVHPKDENYPLPSSTVVTNVMKSNKRANTKPEIVIRSYLHKIGLRFRKDYVIKIDGKCIRPDIVFTKTKLAVFVDGCFWHFCPQHGHIPKSNLHYWEPKLKRNVERDELTNKILQHNGWVVLRLWEHVNFIESAHLIAQKQRELLML